MVKRVLALATAATFLAGAAAFAAPDKNKDKKLTDVTVCPMTGEAVKGEGGGSEVVGKYKVHFCCNGCQPNFDKLSKKDQQKKIAEALKKQKAAKKS